MDGTGRVPLDGKWRRRRRRVWEPGTGHRVRQFKEKRGEK